MAAVRQLATRAGCTAAYIENALTAAEADAAFRACTALPWRVETDAFGPQSRPTYYVGDKDCTFSYVGLRLPPQPWTPELLDELGVTLNDDDGTFWMAFDDVIRTPARHTPFRHH